MSHITKSSAVQQFTSNSSVVDVWRALGYCEDEIASTFAVNPNTHKNSVVLHTVAEYERRGLDVPPNLNVYFGVNPLREGITRGRGGEADVTRVMALFADLDIKDGALADMRECRRVIGKLTKALGIRPTVVIESGHGLQPCWRIANTKSSPNSIRDEDDRQEWRILLRRFGGLVQKMVDEVHPGAKIDNVYELARVLRCPGSFNNKGNEPIPVVTTINAESRAVVRGKLLAALDRRGVSPLGGSVSVAYAKKHTGWMEAVRWIDAQPGTAEAPGDMSAGMLKLCDRAALVKAFAYGTDDENSSYALMRDRVWSAIKLCNEGHGGLSLALLVIRHAYLTSMTSRRGDGKRLLSLSAAEHEFQRATCDAIGKVRGGEFQ